MKTLHRRLIALGGVSVLALILSLILARPESGEPGRGRFPWEAALAVVGVLGTAWWIKRRSLAAKGDREDSLRDLERLRLQPGKVLHLVEVDGVRLLLACSENGIRLVWRGHRTSRIDSGEAT